MKILFKIEKRGMTKHNHDTFGTTYRLEEQVPLLEQSPLDGRGLG